jgi:hypothetical protein
VQPLHSAQPGDGATGGDGDDHVASAGRRIHLDHRGRVFGAAPAWDTGGFCSGRRSRTAAILWLMLAAGVPVLGTGLWLLLISIRQQRSAVLLRMRQQHSAEGPHKPLT